MQLGSSRVVTQRLEDSRSLGSTSTRLDACNSRTFGHLGVAWLFFVALLFVQEPMDQSLFRISKYLAQ